MKQIKRMLAAVLAVLTAVSLVGCHKKDEIAVTVGDVEFTSAYYMCALINADSQAKSKVEESLSEDESSEDIDYYSQKIDDKDYVTWVEDTAMDTLKEIAAYKILCKNNKIEPEEEDISQAETYASYYWSSYGYSSYFEPNGVGEATYTQYMTDSYYSSTYFEFLYGKGGEKEIAEDKVLEKLYDNFVIADVLQASFSSSDTDDTKAELKTKLEGYVTDLKNGKKTFEEVYKEYNNVTDEDETDTDSDAEASAPKDEYASILGVEDTAYESDHYKTAKEMKTGEVKLVTLDDDAGYAIIVKQDIKSDSYYKDTLDITVRHLIADDEFEADIAEYVKDLKTDVNNYAVKQFKVKKIKVPEYE